MNKKRIQAKTGKARVMKKNLDDSEEEYEEDVGEARLFEDPPCNVGLTVGLTMPYVGNKYANIKFNVSLFVPCEADEIEETFEFVRGWIDEKVDGLFDEAEQAGFHLDEEPVVKKKKKKKKKRSRK